MANTVQVMMENAPGKFFTIEMTILHTLTRSRTIYGAKMTAPSAAPPAPPTPPTPSTEELLYKAAQSLVTENKTLKSRLAQTEQQMVQMKKQLQDAANRMATMASPATLAAVQMQLKKVQERNEILERDLKAAQAEATDLRNRLQRLDGDGSTMARFIRCLSEQIHDTGVGGEDSPAGEDVQEKKRRRVTAAESEGGGGGEGALSPMAASTLTASPPGVPLPVVLPVPVRHFPCPPVPAVPSTVIPRRAVTPVPVAAPRPSIAPRPAATPAAASTGAPRPPLTTPAASVATHAAPRPPVVTPAVSAAPPAGSSATRPPAAPAASTAAPPAAPAAASAAAPPAAPAASSATRPPAAPAASTAAPRPPAASSVAPPAAPAASSVAPSAAPAASTAAPRPPAASAAAPPAAPAAAPPAAPAAAPLAAPAAAPPAAPAAAPPAAPTAAPPAAVPPAALVASSVAPPAALADAPPAAPHVVSNGLCPSAPAGAVMGTGNADSAGFANPTKPVSTFTFDAALYLRTFASSTFAGADDADTESEDEEQQTRIRKRLRRSEEMKKEAYTRPLKQTSRCVPVRRLNKAGYVAKGRLYKWLQE